MKLKNLMILNAFFCLLIGIPMLLLPAKFMALFGLNLNPGGMIMAQLYGGALLGNFLIAWFSRKDTGSISLYAAVLYLFIYNGINFLVIFWATTTTGNSPCTTRRSQTYGSTTSKTERR